MRYYVNITKPTPAVVHAIARSIALLLFSMPLQMSLAQTQSSALQIVRQADATSSKSDSTTAERAAPYSAVSVRLSTLRVTSLGRLKDYYRADPGQIIEVETPFERGVFGFLFARIPMRSTQPYTKDFRAELIGVNWRTAAVAAGPLRVSIGTRMATFRMTFNDSTKSSGLRNEEELSIGLTGHVTARATSFLALAASTTYSHVFLHVPEYLSTVTVGVEVTHRLPKTIQNVLK